MDYNITQIRETSRQRYIDLGIIHLPSQVTGISEELLKKASNNTGLRVSQKLLPKISTQLCVDCSKQATQYHHNISYSDRHLNSVIPMCDSCHQSLHVKLKNNIFYDYGLVQSIKNYLTVNPNISLTTLALLHGNKQNDISSTVSRHNIKTNFETNKIIIPDVETLLLAKATLATTILVAKEFNVSNATILKWYSNYNITVDLPDSGQPTVQDNFIRYKPVLLLFYTERKPQWAIANELGISQSGVEKYMRILRESYTSEELTRLKNLRRK